MKTKANGDLRSRLYYARIPMWQLADTLGVHENTVVRWLRHPVTPEQQERIERAIVEILKKREG